MLLTFLMLTAAMACIASGVWGLRGHFLTIGGVPLGMRLLSLVKLAGCLWFMAGVLSAGLSPRWGLGLACMVLSLVLFWWAVAATRHHRLTLAFSADQPRGMVTSGPYALIRHPFYASYIVFWIGTGLASASPFHWVPAAMVIAAYIYAATMEERKFQNSPLAGDYASYRRRTGMLVPHFSAIL